MFEKLNIKNCKIVSLMNPVVDEFLISHKSSQIVEYSSNRGILSVKGSLPLHTLFSCLKTPLNAKYEVNNQNE
jgi:hypothetical protein